MEARNKKTGEKVTNFSVSENWGTVSYIDSTGTLRFSNPTDGEWEILEGNEDIDWSAFRREAAKDILASAIIGNGRDLFSVLNHTFITQMSIMLADELIKQLKEG